MAKTLHLIHRRFPLDNKKEDVKIPRPDKELPKKEVQRPTGISVENVRKFISGGEKYWDRIERKKEF